MENIQLDDAEIGKADFAEALAKIDEVLVKGKEQDLKNWILILANWERNMDFLWLNAERLKEVEKIDCLSKINVSDEDPADLSIADLEVFQKILVPEGIAKLAGNLSVFTSAVEEQRFLFRSKRAKLYAELKLRLGKNELRNASVELENQIDYKNALWFLGKDPKNYVNDILDKTINGGKDENVDSYSNAAKLLLQKIQIFGKLNKAPGKIVKLKNDFNDDWSAAYAYSTTDRLHSWEKALAYLIDTLEFHKERRVGNTHDVGIQAASAANRSVQNQIAEKEYSTGYYRSRSA